MNNYKKLIISTFLLFSIKLSYSQDQQTDCANNLLINQSVQNFKILKYKEGTLAKKKGAFSQVSNNTPEELMSSIISATSDEWYNFNREKKKKKINQDFNYIKNISPDLYYAKLLYKVSFEANGVDYALIKYHLQDNNKPLLGYAESMKSINGKWVTSSESEISEFLFFMIMIDTKYIDHIFKGTKSDNPKLNDIIKSNTFNKEVNLNGVLKELQAILNSEPEKMKSILDTKRLFK